MNTTVQDQRDAPIFIHSALDDLGLDVYAFRIYARLARRAGGNRGAFESVARMAEACGMSDRRCQQALRDLEARKLISRTVRYGDGSGQLTNVYTLLPSSEWMDPPQVVYPLPAPDAPPPPQEVHPPGASRAPEGTPGEGDPREGTPTPPTPPRQEVEVGKDQAERTPPRNSDKVQILMQRHKTTWHALGELSSDRGWKRNQFKTVAATMLDLVRQHGERQVTAALRDVVALGDQVRNPIRWVEAVLTPEARENGAPKSKRLNLLEGIDL